MARMITLWSSDQTLLIALQACKSLIAPLEYLVALWPCDGRCPKLSTLHCHPLINHPHQRYTSDSTTFKSG